MPSEHAHPGAVTASFCSWGAAPGHRRTRVGASDQPLDLVSGPGAFSSLRTRWGSTFSYGALAAGLYNDLNQLTSITAIDGSTTTFGYDNNGNQVRKQDGSGVTQYVYNYDNRLVGIALPNGGSNAFEYDANGLRTKKADSLGQTSYLLDGMSVIAQYAPDGSRQAWYTQSLGRIDEVLSVVNGQGKLWYQADALGSFYALADSSGNVTVRGGYEVFGAPTAVYGSGHQPFGFTGREHDLDSGLVYARARYLQPSTGRWDRPDSLGFVDGPNLYVYARQSPVLLTDPAGMSALLLGPGAVPAMMAAFLWGTLTGIASANLSGFTVDSWSFWGVVLASAVTGALSALFTAPVAAAIVGGLMAGISNAVGQRLAMRSGKQDEMQWGYLIGSILAGVATALMGVALGKVFDIKTPTMGENMLLMGMSMALFVAPVEFINFLIQRQVALLKAERAGAETNPGGVCVAVDPEEVFMSVAR